MSNWEEKIIIACVLLVTIPTTSVEQNMVNNVNMHGELCTNG